MSTTPTSSRSTRANPAMILAFVCLGQFMVFMDVSIVNLALPSIQRGLSMSDISLNYIVTAYATVLGGFLLLGGRLADAYGRRRMLRSGFTLFALGSLSSGLAPNGAALIASRGVQGLGAALVAPAALSILTSTFAEGPERNKALGVWGSLAGIASILGVILGGVLADGPGWQWIFWINVPIGLGVAALAPRVVPESTGGRPGRFDAAGAVTLTGGLLLLIFTLGEATRVGWGTFRTAGGLAGVALLLAAFIAIESRATSPIVPLRIFRLRTMRTANLSAVLVFGTFSALFFFVSLFMQDVYGYSALKAGLAYVPLAVAVAAGAGIASSLMAKLAARRILVAGLTLTAGGLLALWQAPASGPYAVSLLPVFVAVGLGCGLCYVTLQIAAFAGVKEEEAGLGAGLINTSQEAGGALGLAVVATLAYSGFAAHGSAALARAAQAPAIQHAFLVAACLGGAALVIALFMMPRQRRTAPPGVATLPGDSPEAAPAPAEAPASAEVPAPATLSR